MANKKYVSLARLSEFLDNIKERYSQIGHKHKVSDLTDYTVDSQLSPTSTNHVQNKVIDAEFDAIADAMGALELAVDGKADAGHNHNDVYYTESEIDTKLSTKSDTTHNHDNQYDSKGSAAAVQTNLNTVSDALDTHTDNTDIHVTTANKSNWNTAYTHSQSAHARTDATKVADSTTNGNILINGTETNVYSHPNSGVTAGTYKSVTVNAQGHVTAGTNPTTLSGYGITDAETKTDASAKLTEAKTYADTAANKVKNDLLNNAGAAYDTLKELGDLIDDNKDAIDALETVAAGKANATHSHAISDVTNLQSALDGKANSSHGTHVSYSTTAPVMDGVANVGSASTIARSDHKHPTDTSRASKTEFDTHVADTTAHMTSTQKTQLSTAYNHSQAAHAPSNAQANQNAFSNIAVSGQSTVAADTTTDTVTFVGSNVSITTDATNDKVTFSVSDASTGGKGIVQLTNSTSSTSTTTAATPSSVKAAYDLANTAKTTADGKANASHTHTVANITDLTATAKELNYMDGVTSNVQTQLDGKAASGHTHNYAGSSSAGGAATSANKVNSSLTVKLNGGTTEGTNMFTFNGSAAKSVNITPSSIGASASGHTHDDRYYTETEVDTKLFGKANTSHGNHVPTTQTANNATFLRNDNTWQKVTPTNIGAAASSHTHNALNVPTTGGMVALYYDDTTKKNHWFKPDTTYPTTQKINLGSTTSRTWDNLYVNDGIYVNGVACSLDGHSHEDIEEDIEYNLQYSRDLDSAIQTKVSNTVRINGYQLTGNVALTASDVGAVPTTRKVNSKALSGDITLTASDVGAAASSHNHSASNITSGTLPIERGGTGATKASAAEYNILGGLAESTTATTGSTPIVCRYAEPSTGGGVLYYKKASNIADYIKGTITPSGIGAAESSHTHTNFGSGTNKMNIAGNGNVYPTTTETQQLGLNANKWGAILCKSVTQSSDERIKENLSTDMDKYVAMLDLIEPTSYYFKSDADKEDRKRNVGYIAQRVQDALAEVGLEDSDFAALAYDKEEAEGTHTYGLDYSQFIPILHAKIKQVEDKYEQRIAELEKTITEIKAKN